MLYSWLSRWSHIWWPTSSPSVRAEEDETAVAALELLAMGAVADEDAPVVELLETAQTVPGQQKLDQSKEELDAARADELDGCITLSFTEELDAVALRLLDDCSAKALSSWSSLLVELQAANRAQALPRIQNFQLAMIGSVCKRGTP